MGARILPPQLIREIMDIGLSEVCRIDSFPLDTALISALFHRFHPETGTFSLPCGETDITLEVRSDGVLSLCDPLPDDCSVLEGEGSVDEHSRSVLRAWARKLRVKPKLARAKKTPTSDDETVVATPLMDSPSDGAESVGIGRKCHRRACTLREFESRGRPTFDPPARDQVDAFIEGATPLTNVSAGDFRDKEEPMLPFLQGRPALRGSLRPLEPTSAPLRTLSETFVGVGGSSALIMISLVMVSSRLPRGKLFGVLGASFWCPSISRCFEGQHRVQFVWAVRDLEYLHRVAWVPAILAFLLQRMREAALGRVGYISGFIFCRFVFSFPLSYFF
ncbi:hypothetical protein AMTR_s00028p00240610 [Amborella trichopoda]|uniref:Aminotransferase-like plant mobile domain-containing protein n=1 Tax=Amborella trichopoda TaxID=13333 RepID=W1PL17_AMBTC|nr:hypothetical protein AMTR_s00028p00240610 [Amborella trichopoda]